MKPEQLLRKVFPPMLATLAEEPPRDEEKWTYELKYDGFRAVAGLAGGELALWSRNELNLAERFPHIAAILSKLKLKDAVLDGEIVVLDEQGAPRFQLLQQGDNREIIFFFDILWLDGKDLRRQTYAERRAMLEKVLKRPPAGVRLAATIEPPGEAALKKAAGEGWEGIIAKKNTSCYEPRRSKDWLKIKALNEQELVIIGWNPSTHSTREVGSLHLAYNEGGELHYAGKVGTGFSAKMRVWLRDELAKDVVPVSPAKDAPRIRVATWTKPRLVAQVAFTEWTSDNRLRHPSFLGLREDKSAGEVVRERAMGKSESKSGSRERKKPGERGVASGGRKKSATSSNVAASHVAGRESKSTKTQTSSAPGSRSPAPHVTLSNPDRILYPRDKITKQDVADYYDAVAEPMIRALRDRPLSLEHWNQGIDKPSWFHQHLGREAPDWLTTIETPTRVSSRKTVRHLVVDDRESLRWLAQMSALTIHMWASRGESLESADWMLFDLDPAKGKGIEQAIEAAGVVRGLLENLDLPSVPKTSGKRGIHVMIPLAPGYSHEQVADFACGIAAAVAKEVPTMTVERAIAGRRGRLYLDCLQNGYGKTVVAPYSLRAIDGAPVSAPLRWEEINKKLDPRKFNLRTMPDRLAKVGDLFAGMFKNRAKLPVLK